MPSGVGGPIAPYGTKRLPPFFVISLFQEAAAAGAMQLELVAAARAAIAKMENFMVVVVGCVVVLLIIIDQRDLQFCVSSSTYRYHFNLTLLLHSSAKIEH